MYLATIDWTDRGNCYAFDVHEGEALPNLPTGKDIRTYAYKTKKRTGRCVDEISI